jgi:hypothetical protein
MQWSMAGDRMPPGSLLELGDVAKTAAVGDDDTDDESENAIALVTAGTERDAGVHRPVTSEFMSAGGATSPCRLLPA